MELLDGFGEFSYPNEIGPGVYDIHSPRVPSVEEMVTLLEKAAKVIDPDLLWVKPPKVAYTNAWQPARGGGLVDPRPAGLQVAGDLGCGPKFPFPRERLAHSGVRPARRR